MISGLLVRTGLEDLQLSKNVIKELPDMGNLAELKSVSMSNNQVREHIL